MIQIILDDSNNIFYIKINLHWQQVQVIFLSQL